MWSLSGLTDFLRNEVELSWSMTLSHSGGVGAEGKQLGPGEEIQIFLLVWTLMPNYLQGLKVSAEPLHWLYLAHTLLEILL